MTNDQQQVEAWRKQFEKWFLGCSPTSLHRHNDGTYTYATAQNAWGVWCAAKRNQPVIELPAIESPEGYYDRAEVFAAITAAGYSYKVKAQA